MTGLTRLSLARRVPVALAIFAVTVFFAARLPSLRTETLYRAHLGADHPAMVALDRVLEGFVGGLATVVVYECGDGLPCASALDAAALRMVDAVSKALQRLDVVARVDSPANAPVLMPGLLELEVRRLVVAGAPAPDLDQLARQALRDPSWQRTLVSEDGSVGALIISSRSSDSDEARQLIRELEEQLAPQRAAGFRFAVIGPPAEMVTSDDELARDVQRLVPLLVVLVAIVVLAIFRTWQSVAGCLAVVSVSILWTFGAMAWLGWPQSSLTQPLAPLLLVIGLCDSVHVLVRLRRLKEGGADATTAWLETARQVGPPCFVTTATTAAGFLSFTSSDLASFVRFGCVAAFGVGAALILTFTLLPMLLSVLPEEHTSPNAAARAWDAPLTRLAGFTQRHAGTLIAGGVVLLLVCAAGVARVTVDVDQYKLIGEGNEMADALRFVDQRLRRVETLEVEIALPDGQSLHDEGALLHVARAAQDLEAIAGLGPAHSVVDAIAWTRRLTHGDDPEAERLAESGRSNSALLELIGFSDPRVLDPWVNLSRTRLRISLEADKLLKSERERVLAEARRRLSAALPAGWQTTLTGPFVMYYVLGQDIQETQLRSFAGAGVLTWLLLSLFLGRRAGRAAAGIGWATLGMLPTLLPVVAVLGAMGFLGIYLDAGSAMVAAIVIGVGVDHAVHMLGEAIEARREGRTGEQAAVRAVVRVGLAVIVTSLALTIGFLSLSLSSWQSVAAFGGLSAIAILGSGVAALLLLPALVFATTRWKGPTPVAVLLVFGLFAAPIAARSETAPADVRAAAGDDAEALLERGFRTLFDCDLVAEVFFETRNGRGESVERTLHLARRRIGDRMHTYGRFISPPWARDIAVLMVENGTRDPDLMVFTPELERVRRLSAAQGTDAFFGTDLWYEDLQERHARQWSLIHAEDATQGGRQTLRLDATPREALPYARAAFTIERSSGLMLAIELFQEGREEPFRSVILDPESTMSSGECLIPTRLTVQNPRRGTETTVRFESVTLNPDLDDSLFRAISLESGRPIPGLRSEP